jgi:hypothetical protein
LSLEEVKAGVLQGTYVCHPLHNFGHVKSLCLR